MTNASRPDTARTVSFANVDWEAPHANQASNARPDAPRSLSYDHARRRSSTFRLPSGPVRSLSFCDTRWEPSGPNLALRQDTVAGPFAFLNPTTAIFDVWNGTGEDLTDVTDPEKGRRARIQWNAREFRKGRQVFLLPREAPLAVRLRKTSKPKRLVLGIARMFTVFPYWDVSWLIGVSFTVGCMLFIACGFFYWLPIAHPETTFPHEKAVAGGLTSFIGATLFQIGAVLLFFESYNQRAEAKFGNAVGAAIAGRFNMRRRTRSSKEEDSASSIDTNTNSQADTNNRPPQESNSLEQGQSIQLSNPRPAQIGNSDPFGERAWQWLPSWHDVKSHYIYEIGFLASLTMSVGATVFYLCGILALPGINLSKEAKQGIYYLPYLVGGILFWLSSILYVLETQPNWYTPQPFKIGWHIGVFNMIGGIGWTLAASFGYCDPYWCKYQSELSLIWASCAFTFGSALQWYESLDKYVFIIED